MMQRGRKSGAALAVVPAGNHRLAPVVGLTEGEKTVWLRTVNSRPADWFGSEHVPLLVNYARHCCRADLIDQQMQAFQPEWLEQDSGFKRFERLSKLFRDETNAINVLARAMRLTHQSLYRADKASTTVESNKGEKPWQHTED
jgi:hypothetical protein